MKTHATVRESVRTKERSQMIDITDRVSRAVIHQPPSSSTKHTQLTRKSHHRFDPIPLFFSPPFSSFVIRHSFVIRISDFVIRQRRHSCRSASIGSIRAAVIAGYNPNPIPINPLIIKLPPTDHVAIDVR